jgi:transposase
MSYSVKDVAERFCVSQSTVLHWLATGQLVGLNVGRDPGKAKPRWRIPQSSLEIFEASRSSKPAPAPTRRKRKPTTDVIEFIK